MNTFKANVNSFQVISMCFQELLETEGYSIKEIIIYSLDFH